MGLRALGRSEEFEELLDIHVMSEYEDLKRQLDAASELLDTLAQQATDTRKLWVYEEATRRTHHFVLFHICARLGVSYETFEEHYRAVFNRHLAVVLDQAHEVSPASAPLLDARSFDDFDSCDPLPRLFPDGPI